MSKAKKAMKDIPVGKDKNGSTRAIQEQYESRLGRMAMLFSLMHMILERFAWNTWGIPHEFARILTKDLPIKQLSAKLQSSFKEMEIDKDVSLDLKRLLTRVEKLSEKRNEFMHGLWVMDGHKIVFLPRKSAGDADPTSPSLEDLEALVNSVIELIVELGDFSKRNMFLGAIGLATRKKYGKTCPKDDAKVVPKQHDTR